MGGLRWWLLTLTVICFACGAAAGRLWTLKTDRRAELGGAFPDFAEHLAQRFELSLDRRKYLRVILEEFEHEERRLEERHLQEFRHAIEPELRELSIEFDSYIRDRVIPPARRAEYDRVAMRPTDSGQPESEQNSPQSPGPETEDN